jgi:hypothetical protein
MRWERVGWSVNFNSSWEENNFAYDFFRAFCLFWLRINYFIL